MNLLLCVLSFALRSQACSGHLPSSLQSMSRLVKDVDEVRTFLRVHVAAATEAEHDELIKAQCLHLQAKFRTSPVSIQEATEIIELLGHRPWITSDTRDLCQALARMSTASQRAGIQPLQTFYEVDNFLMPNTWDVLDDPLMSESAKICFFCKFLARLGLAHPTEKIVQHCVIRLW